MSNYRRLPIPDLVKESLTLYTNAADDPEIAALLADPYGYAPEDFAAGLALRQAVVDGSEETGAETADSRLATGQVKRATRALRAQFVEHREAARDRYRRDSETWSALRLSGDTPDSRAAIIEAARRFYGTAEERPDLVAEIRGLTPAIVAESQALIQAAETRDSAQDDEAGEARTASESYKAAVDALREHAAELANTAERALKGRPGLLRKLGL
ncbi:hypothetical protein [Rubrivirga sp. IMCC45206]|uniref:hypothetical protein n=1 Tax=Rubrivirga sp. IMCC45206 TaxID=3391614 RepID=UPI00398F9143